MFQVVRIANNEFETPVTENKNLYIADTRTVILKQINVQVVTKNIHRLLNAQSYRQ